MARLREKQPNGVPLSRKKPEAADPRTDPSRWRLLDEQGRQTWHYLRSDEEIKEWPQSIADRYFLGLPTVWSFRGPVIWPGGCTDQSLARDYHLCLDPRLL